MRGGGGSRGRTIRRVDWFVVDPDDGARLEWSVAGFEFELSLDHLGEADDRASGDRVLDVDAATHVHARPL